VNERSSKTGDLDRDDPAVLVRGLRVERLRELDDVDAVLAQRGADRRRRVRLPAGICSLMSVRTFLRHRSACGAWRLLLSVLSLVDLLDLVERELDRHLALEDVHEHLELLGVRVDVDDLAVEVGERADVTFTDSPSENSTCARVAGAPATPPAWRIRSTSAVESGEGLAPRRRRRSRRRALDDRPGLVVQVHVDQDVPGAVRASRSGTFCPSFVSITCSGRNDDAAEPLLLVHRDDPVLEIGLHLVLVPGVGVDHVPVEHLRSVSPYCPRSTSRHERPRTWSAPQRYARRSRTR
jgi:hypothetical protein